MKTRFQSLICAISATLVLSCTPLIVGELAGQELPQCFVGSKPCGSPETLYRQIIQCLQDPNLCNEPKSGLDPVRHEDESRSPSAVSTNAPLPAASRRMTPIRAPDVPRQRSVSGDVAVSTKNGGAETAESANHTVDELAHDLPLNPGIRDLADVMPTDVGAIELRLGLRRTSVAGNDMRGRTPSAAQIVQALEPRGRSAR
jgi:hypothetical protein